MKDKKIKTGLPVKIKGEQLDDEIELSTGLSRDDGDFGISISYNDDLTIKEVLVTAKDENNITPIENVIKLHITQKGDLDHDEVEEEKRADRQFKNLKKTKIFRDLEARITALENQ